MTVLLAAVVIVLS